MSSIDAANLKQMFAKVIEVCTLHKMKGILYLIDDNQDKLVIFSTQHYEELSTLISSFETTKTIYMHDLFTEDMNRLWMLKANSKKSLQVQNKKALKYEGYHDESNINTTFKDIRTEKSTHNSVTQHKQQTNNPNSMYDSSQLSLNSDSIDKKMKQFNFNSTLGYDSSYDSSHDQTERDTMAYVKNSLSNINVKLPKLQVSNTSSQNIESQQLKIDPTNLGKKRKADVYTATQQSKIVKPESVDIAYTNKILNELKTMKGDKEIDKIKNAVLEIYNGCNQASDDESSDDSFIKDLKRRADQSKRKAIKSVPATVKSSESPFKLEDLNSKKYTEDISNQTLYPGLKQQTGGIFTQTSNLNIMADMSNIGYKL